MVEPPQPAAAAAADGDPPTAFVPEATNNADADMGHPQVDHGGGVATAGGGGRGVATARGGSGGRGVVAARGGRGGRGVAAARGGPRRTRTNGVNYSLNEIAQMLEIIEDVLPISGAE